MPTHFIIAVLAAGLLGLAPGPAFSEPSLSPPGGWSAAPVRSEEGRIQPLELPRSGADPVAASLLRAWRLPAPTLAQRVDRTRTAGVKLGMRQLEGPARALLRDPRAGGPSERARAAVELAPDLPAAHFALATARFRDRSPLDAFESANDGVAALGRHAESRLWLRATFWAVAGAACVLAGLGFLALAAGIAFGPVARALPRPTERWGAASSKAALAALVLVPAALGEGLLGIACMALVVAVVPASLSRRASVVLAAGLCWLGLFPAVERTAAAIAAFGADPTVHALRIAERGLPDQGQLLRLEALRDEDGEAAHALALRARREGRLDDAATLFGPALGTGNPRLLNNAANVELALSHSERAIELYERAARASDSPVVRVNLSQAYGTVVRLDQQDLALAEAQALDAVLVADLSRALAQAPAGTTLDLVAAPSALDARLEDASAASAIAAEIRGRLAPGALGSSALLAGIGLAAALVAGLLLGWLTDGAAEESLGPVSRLGGGLEPAARAKALAERRARESRRDRIHSLASWTLPGAAGLLGGRPLLGLSAVGFAAATVAVWGLRQGPVPDPLAVGAGVVLMAGTAAIFGGIATLALTLLCIATREGR